MLFLAVHLPSYIKEPGVSITLANNCFIVDCNIATLCRMCTLLFGLLLWLLFVNISHVVLCASFYGRDIPKSR